MTNESRPMCELSSEEVWDRIDGIDVYYYQGVFDNQDCEQIQDCNKIKNYLNEKFHELRQDEMRYVIGAVSDDENAVRQQIEQAIQKRIPKKEHAVKLIQVFRAVS